MKLLPERILCAANWYPDLVLPHLMPDLDPRFWLPVNCERGVVFCGAGHVQCMYQMIQIFGLRQSQVLELDGFLTSHNRWVDRKEGIRLAHKQGQIAHLGRVPFILHSEDLY